MKNTANPSPDAKKGAGKASSPKKSRRRIILLVLLAVLIPGSILAALNSPKIKNALLLRFGTPQVYMAYVETNHLLALGKEWDAGTDAFFALFEGMDLSGAKIDVHVNQLLSALFPKESATSKKPDLSGISLLFLTETKEENFLFRLAAQANDTPLASLDFLSDAADEQLYLSCPQAGSAALAFPTGEEDPFVMLLHHLGRLLGAFQDSVRRAVSSNPYAYLLPYLDVITEVTLERGVPVPASGTDLSAIRLNMLLSLDTALDIAAEQLDALKETPDIADTLLPYYEFSIWLLGYLAQRYPADLLVTAYVDGDGNILGHEFYVLSQGETILSLTGILTPSPAGGKSGELTFFSSLGKEPLTVLLSVSQLGFDLQTGLASGKINVSCDRLSSLHFQLLLSSSGSLPKLTFLVRTLGVAALSFDLTPTNIHPHPFPTPQDYTETYRLPQLSAFLQSLDFSGILSDFYKETGISLPALQSILSKVLSIFE